MELFAIFVGAVFVQNIVLAQFLGLCPFLGVSQKLSSSLGMGAAVVFVMVMASVITWLVQNFILIPFEVGYLRTIAFILVIASLVQLVETLVKYFSPALYKALGVYLPLITTNCAILGVAIININESLTFIEATFNGFANAIGFTLALLLFAAIRERLELMDVPECLQGPSIALVTAGLMGLAFLGFSGLL